MAENKRAVGARYEALAAAYVEKQGAQVLATNFRTRTGEIDLVFTEGSYLVFGEVKYRKSKASGRGADAVHLQKQRKICRMADYYRVRFQITDSTPIRFDVLECMGNPEGAVSISWFRNAFPYHPGGYR